MKIQNMRVTDMEFEIEIPGKPDDPDTPDFSIVQRAWWDVIKLVYKDYEEKGKCPMRLTLEMRVSPTLPANPQSKVYLY